jgi:hypothetical protein
MKHNLIHLSPSRLFLLPLLSVVLLCATSCTEKPT